MVFFFSLFLCPSLICNILDECCPLSCPGVARTRISSAGITISKQRNRLKADIVEALQVLKCMICRDLIFR
ncbi:hypothetical protein B0H16DRAFT_1341423 [Mycena metata]|uniref:Secreted protein n=1 Tax=Mycena metata TaxID=1033252 RepID=A0AAD7MED6_9AGAR|nr:hypothetical protein B0H16DRAFT_1341423 [Mycena metata]